MKCWKKMSIEATKHRYIVGIFDLEDEDGEAIQRMEILYFNGIDNRWNSLNGNIRDLTMKDINCYIPLPELP